MFSDKQNADLAAPLHLSNVKSRKQSGRSLSYIEGWKTIEEANRIFGFDGWTRETFDVRMVAEKEREIGENKVKGWGVSYVAKVKIIVFAGDRLVTREGIGAGHGIDRDLGQAHESAIKEAETDAMKRALMTFGYPFGLALYDKQQEHVTNDTPKAIDPNARSIADELISRIGGCVTKEELDTYAKGDNFTNKVNRISEEMYNEVRAAFKSRMGILKERSSQPVPAAG